MIIETKKKKASALFDYGVFIINNFGCVFAARVITDRDTGRSRGFGFVNFTSEESATSALSMDGQVVILCC
jgi:RNA recognition motif-containing protein